MYTLEDLKEAFNFYYMTGFPHQIDFDKWLKEYFSKRVMPLQQNMSGGKC